MQAGETVFVAVAYDIADFDFFVSRQFAVFLGLDDHIFRHRAVRALGHNKNFHHARFGGFAVVHALAGLVRQDDEIGVFLRVTVLEMFFQLGADSVRFLNQVKRQEAVVQVRKLRVGRRVFIRHFGYRRFGV